MSGGAGRGGGEETVRTIVGEIRISREEHRRCLHCIRYRPSNQTPGAGRCGRPMYDARGKFLGRANETVTEHHVCDHFVSRIGGQQ